MILQKRKQTRGGSFLLLVIILILFIASCGYRNSSYIRHENGKLEHEGFFFGFTGDATPGELAYANLLNALAERMRRDDFKFTHAGVVRNFGSATVYWQHPELPIKLPVKPDEFVFLPLRYVPNYIHLLRRDGRKLSVRVPKFNEPRYFLGAKVDFIYSIHRTEN